MGNRDGMGNRDAMGNRDDLLVRYLARLRKSPLRADANRGSSNVGFAKRERRRVQNSILSDSSRRTPRESSGAAANRLSEWGKAGAS